MRGSAGRRTGVGPLGRPARLDMSQMCEGALRSSVAQVAQPGRSLSHKLSSLVSGLSGCRLAPTLVSCAHAGAGRLMARAIPR